MPEPERSRVVAIRTGERTLDVDVLVGDEEEQQDRRMALESEPDVLAQAVGDKVEIARPRAQALGCVRST